jgi:hypothetical protein
MILDSLIMQEDSPILAKQITPRWVWVRRLLLCMAVIQGSALLAVLAPSPWHRRAAESLQVGPLPRQPIVGYLARQCSALYVLHAATILIMAAALPSSLEQVKWLGWVTLVFGLLILNIDLGERMPGYWTILESSVILMAGTLLVVAHRWASQPDTLLARG